MVAKAAKLIDRVPTYDEDKFREEMRKMAMPLARHNLRSTRHLHA